MRFNIITIFPDAFSSYFSQSIINRAQRKGLISVKIINLRDFAGNKHKTVDDSPYGGGPGMVIKIEPVYKAVQSLKPKSKIKKSEKFQNRTVLFSTRGKKFTEKEARRLAKYRQLIFICGKYEGVDERAAKYVADEEISIGEYVLSGGELPAMVVIDAVARFTPGVLDKKESLESIKGSYPVYTRPEIFSPAKNKNWKVPKILLSGDHKKIAQWRKKFSIDK